MSNKNYTLNEFKQLIDLNGNIINFDLTFKVISKNNVPFIAAVATQEMLDSDAQIDFKDAPGELQANIIANSNIYQNYFLILKAKDNVCDVNVQIFIKEIEPAIEQKPMQRHKRHVNSDPYQLHNKKDSMFNMNYLVLLLVGIFIVYFYFTLNNKGSVNTGVQLNIPNMPAVPKFTSSTLLSRINNLPI